MDTVNPIHDEHRKLASDLANDGVEYAIGTYVDISGRAKSKVVPIGKLPNMLAGSERYTPRGLGFLGPMLPQEDETVAMPDLSLMRVLPWDPRFVWMPADLLYGGTEPFALCCRSILKRQLDRAEREGWGLSLGVEPEIYVYQPTSDRGVGYLEPIAPSGGIKPNPGYDVEATLDSMPFLSRMVRYLQQADFGVFSFDHEGGFGQYEFDFEHGPALEMADKMTLFRLMAKQAAKEEGLAVTFMPKPYTGAFGAGFHFNLSLESLDDGSNLFREADHTWTKMAYGFVAGLLRHAPAMTAIMSPTVNSFKRLTTRLGDGTASWAPVWPVYGENNRSCLLRLPANRPAIENRGVDSTANVYLASAFQLAAGLEGIADGLHPGPPVEELTYDWKSHNSPRLPRNLLEAIEAFEADPLVHEVYPTRFVEDYVEMKHLEWESYHSQVSQWERDKYLSFF